jgi:hypothetical protein
MFFHLGYWYDGNGQAKIIVCSKAHPWVKALFAQCGGLVPPPLNNMEVPVHIPNGQTKDVAMETWNLLVEGEFDLMFQVEGVQNFTPLQIAQKVLIDPQITTFKPFDRFHCPRDWIQPKNKIWTKSGQSFFMRQTSPSMLCDTLHS